MPPALEVCRLCMGKNKLRHSVIDDNIFKKVQTCLRLEIDPDDEYMTALICLKCTLKIREYFQFRQQCWRVQRLLLESFTDAQFQLVTITEVNLSVHKEPQHVLPKTKPTPKSSRYIKHPVQMNKQNKDIMIDITEIHTPAPSSPEPSVSLPTTAAPSPTYSSASSIASEVYPARTIASVPSPNTHCQTSHSQMVSETQEEETETYSNKESSEELDASNEEQDSNGPNSPTITTEALEMEVLESNTQLHESCVEEYIMPDDSIMSNLRRRRSKISGRELYKSLLMACTICGKMIERNRLEGHINRHQGKRPYSCPVEDCSATFHCKHARRLHVRCRHGNESFACDICDKVYKAKRDLLGHKRETHGDPKFECDICPKKFTTRSRLKQHRLYHTGERNHPCRACDMRFFSNFQLKVHMRTHTKSYPYVCMVCKKSFRYGHIAKDHIVNDHGIDITLKRDWVIQHPEPDPEEVDVKKDGPTTVIYNVQRLSEQDEDENHTQYVRNTTALQSHTKHADTTRERLPSRS